MKKLISKQKWDNHISHKYVYYNDDEIIGMVNVNLHNDDGLDSFESLYVNEKYRGKGIGNIIMDDIMKDNPQEMACLVHKDNWVNKFYNKYGFNFYYEEDENYYWMLKKENKNEK